MSFTVLHNSSGKGCELFVLVCQTKRKYIHYRNPYVLYSFQHKRLGIFKEKKNLWPAGAAWHYILTTAWWVVGAVSSSYPPSGECHSMEMSASHALHPQSRSSRSVWCVQDMPETLLNHLYSCTHSHTCTCSNLRIQATEWTFQLKDSNTSTSSKCFQSILSLKTFYFFCLCYDVLIKGHFYLVVILLNAYLSALCYLFKMSFKHSNDEEFIHLLKEHLILKFNHQNVSNWSKD